MLPPLTLHEAELRGEGVSCGAECARHRTIQVRLDRSGGADQRERRDDFLPLEHGCGERGDSVDDSGTGRKSRLAHGLQNRSVALEERPENLTLGRIEWQ